ncbi:aminotransferase [Rhizobium halophytocola]|nr:aminotransferase [Rhizobium halophytocola]
MPAHVRVNPLVERLAPPPIPAVQAFLRRYDGSAGPVIDLSQAVPGYPPHPDLLGWLADAAGRRDLCGYGDIQGEPVLRKAYAADVNSAYSANVDARQVQITAGGNQAFFALALALLKPGDDVIVIRPYYFNHEMTLRMLGVGVTLVDADPEEGFSPVAARVEAAIGANTRAVFVVTPNNPTGAVYSPERLDELYEACRRHGVVLVADETYRDFLPPELPAPHALFGKPDWQSHFVHLYSFSKVFCVPGHRLGALVCGAEVMEQLAKVMDNLQICAPRPAQHAVALALGALSAWREGNRQIIDARRQAFIHAIAARPGWQITSIGAYFAYLRHPFGEEGAMAVTERLASEYGILMLPGTCFGDNQQGYLRAAFANADVEVIRTLATRLPTP